MAQGLSRPTGVIPSCGTRCATALLFAFVIASGALHAQTIQLSLPDTAARRGDTLLVPIRVSALTLGDSVYSGQITYSYNPGVIQVFDVETAGTLLQGLGSVQFNRTTNRIAFALTTRLTGSGVLVYLRVAVAMSPTSSSSALGFTAAQLNEGRPAVTTTNGSLRILAITISPKSPPTNLVVGDSLQFSVTGDVKLPVIWSTSDTSVATIDAAGKMRARRTGQLKVHIADAQGLRDSTNLFLINSLLLRSLTARIRDTSHTQTLSFNLPIYISDVTGLGTLSAQFSLTYNGAILLAVDVLSLGSMTASWGPPTFHPTGGKVDVALAGTQTLSGAGILVYVRFRVAANAASSTTISFANVRFNEEINANVVSGTFTPRAAPLLVLSPSSAVLTKGDTLRFSVASGGTPPYAWTSNNPIVLSVDRPTGLISALSRGTTTVTVVDSFGFAATTGSIVVNDVRISLPDTLVKLADSTDVPVFTENLTGLGIFAYETRITYNRTIVSFAGIVQSSTLSSSFSVSVKDTLDTLRIAAAGPNTLTGRGALLLLRFKPASGATIGQSSNLNIVAFRFNEPGPSTPTATFVNGRLSIGTQTSVELLPKELPSGYVLEQNFPNPFNPTTAIVFEIARTERVRLDVYSLLGQYVENLVDETLPPGRYQVRWTAENFKSGVYFYRFTAGNYSAARKLVLLR